MSVELENTQFINDLNKSGSSSSDSSCNSSINEPNKDIVNKEDTTRCSPAKSSQFTLVEELINSSEDEKIYEKKLDKVNESYFSQDNQKSIASLTHNCTYYESVEDDKCSHSLSMHQNICLKCDHSSELKDSLDYMAFTSPVKSEIATKKWNEILTVDNSPTAKNDSQKLEEEICTNMDHSVYNDNNSPEMNTIIDETLDQTSITKSFRVYHMF